MKHLLSCFALCLFSSLSAAHAQDSITYPRLKASAELGFAGVLEHRLQFGEGNTYFDLRKDGAQDTLFAVSKWSLDLALDPTHSLTFLYQPLSIETRNTLREDMRQDNVAFPAGTAMGFLYDFPFFRASYLYDFNPDPFEELAVGASLQLRDAVLEFASLDGEKLVSRRNVGPVPILKFRSRHRLSDRWWWGSEVDGFYAAIRFINGGSTDVTGAILDANLRVGTILDEAGRYAPYLNVRYLGGGGQGTQSNPSSGDGYSSNWLHSVFITLGIQTDIF